MALPRCLERPMHLGTVQQKHRNLDILKSLERCLHIGSVLLQFLYLISFFVTAQQQLFCNDIRKRHNCIGVCSRNEAASS